MPHRGTDNLSKIHLKQLASTWVRPGGGHRAAGACWRPTPGSQCGGTTRGQHQALLEAKTLPSQGLEQS